MKIVLWSVVALVTFGVAYSDTSLSSNVADEAKREAQLPISDLSLGYFENQDGTLSLGYYTEYEPHRVYLWRGVGINPKNVPDLNKQSLGMNYPASCPYEGWSGWNARFIETPPLQYYWDSSRQGFVAGWATSDSQNIGRGHPIFFRAGKDVYMKSELPGGAIVTTNEARTVIPTFLHQP